MNSIPRLLIPNWLHRGTEKSLNQFYVPAPFLLKLKLNIQFSIHRILFLTYATVEAAPEHKVGYKRRSKCYE